MMSEAEARAVWSTADAVCFDVDSTVIQEEGIDELAKFLGKADDVLHITRQAMCGGLPYRDALKQRLHMLSPSQHKVADFKRQQALRLSKGVSELVELLRHREVPVFLISGGFRCLILPVAETLGVCPERVIANRLLFDYDGNYWGFDQSQPTSASGGKPSVIQRLIDQHKFRRVVMIGDGATDAEAAPPASLFIGYGGNVVREKVRQMSPWFVHNFQELTDELRS